MLKTRLCKMLSFPKMHSVRQSVMQQDRTISNITFKQNLRNLRNIKILTKGKYKTEISKPIPTTF